MSMQNGKIIDQKAYLKKYLSGDKEKKKKKKDKKHKKSAAARVKIIDDDAVDANNEEVDEELLFGGEDAPQIVGEYIETDPNARRKWRNIAVKDEEEEEAELHIKPEPKAEADSESSLWGRKAAAIKVKDEFSPTRDESPTQRSGREKSPPLEIKIKQEKRSSSREMSPTPNRDRDGDHSPPRRRREVDQSPPRRRRNSDQSPPRRRRDVDQSPPRRRNADQSPPRRRNADQSPPRRRNADQSPPRKRRSPDQSPTRRRREVDQSSPRRRRSRAQSPSRDQSPKQRFKKEERRTRWAKASPSPSPPPTHNKSKANRTLDGKKAGLQDALSVKAETEERRRQEQQMFETMPGSVSGHDAEVRVRSTGRRGKRARDAAAEDPAEQQRKEAHEQKKKEIYDRWGKGLKQIEDQKSRHAEMVHEAAKPVARYADDADLEQHLREQERADDPMLEYMRQKKKKDVGQSNAPKMPVYEGSYPENRFGIRPGYRWDGVDRSSGYEQRWFDRQNAKIAAQDEAYKYSVEDM